MTNALKFLFILTCVVALLPGITSAQLVRGQYELEAPLRSWNVYGFTTASGLAMGGARYAHAFDLSATTSNPALLTRLSKFSIVVDGSYNQASLFKYDIVNTGILSSTENANISNYLLDFGGISFNYNGWGLALSVSLPEIYDRPPSAVDLDFDGQIYYTIELIQEGFLRNYNLGLSRQFGDSFSVGIGLNYETGSLERGYWESWVGADINLSSVQKHDLKGYYLNGGVVFDVSQGFSLAAVFRTPYTREADSESLVQNLTPPGGTDIRIESQGKSTFKQPLMLGGGLSYFIQENFRIAADLSFFNWSKYEVELIGVPEPRDFRNTVTLNTGIEYKVEANAFKQKIEIPLWLGFGYDRQPMREPNSTYYNLSLGVGLRGSRLFLDAGGSYGWESGSGDGLSYVRLAATLGFRL